MANPNGRKGAKFEIDQEAYLQKAMGDRKIRRIRTHGSKDEGDIANLETQGVKQVTILVTSVPANLKVTPECKNVNPKNFSLPGAIREAQVEAANAGCDLGVVIHKRHGKADPGEQIVSMRAADFVRLLGGQP